MTEETKTARCARRDAETILIGLLVAFERNPLSDGLHSAIRAHCFQAKALLPPQLVEQALGALDAKESLRLRLHCARGASTLNWPRSWPRS
jgi:hypothetical protein